MTASFVYDAVRTPFGRYGKALAGVRPDDLAASTLRALLVRHPGLDPARIGDVFMGDANQAGEDNRDVARMAVLLAGLPDSVTGTTINRLCGSGLDAAMQASRMIETQDAEVAIAGGVESMSRAPWVSLTEDGDRVGTALGWRLANPHHPAEIVVPMGATAELLADEYGISRDEQDAFALRSHLAAAKAWDDGIFEGEIVGVPGVDLTRDEGVRPDSSLEALGGLKTVFREDGGTVTAGNSSPLSDGSSMVLIGAEGALGDTEPLARIAGRGAMGTDPNHFGIAPVEAANRALARAGKTWADVDLVELNEAFAAQSLACLRLWPELDPAKVNVHGGAIAIGHPLGASGGRILGRAAHALQQRGGGVAVAAICIGVGQGLAVVLER
ncbi:MAG: acetyl-CoA C-acyltransferase [Microbacteriaceae bacterium]